MLQDRPEGLDLTSFRSPQLKRGSLVAYRRFGNGNHPAGLNFGDRFSYALAKERKLPLLFKGDDFATTDLRPGTVIQRCRSETNPSFQRSA